MIDNEEEKSKEEFSIIRRERRVIDNANTRRDRRTKYAELGLCSTCDFLHGETSRYGTKRYWCAFGSHPRMLHPNDPLDDCTEFQEVGKMSLSMMISMAIPIEAARPKRIGFIIDEDSYYTEPADF